MNSDDGPMSPEAVDCVPQLYASIYIPLLIIEAFTHPDERDVSLQRRQCSLRCSI